MRSDWRCRVGVTLQGKPFAREVKKSPTCFRKPSARLLVRRSPPRTRRRRPRPALDIGRPITRHAVTKIAVVAAASNPVVDVLNKGTNWNLSSKKTWNLNVICTERARLHRGLERTKPGET